MCHILIKFICCTSNLVDREVISDPITIPESTANHLESTLESTLENTVRNKSGSPIFNKKNLLIKK